MNKINKKLIEGIKTKNHRVKSRCNDLANEFIKSMVDSGVNIEDKDIAESLYWGFVCGYEISNYWQVFDNQKLPRKSKIDESKSIKVLTKNRKGDYLVDSYDYEKHKWNTATDVVFWKYID